MRWDQVEGNWRQYRGKVRKHWGRLTDQHIAQINGKRDQLVRKIQEVYRVSEEEAASGRRLGAGALPSAGFPSVGVRSGNAAADSGGLPGRLRKRRGGLVSVDLFRSLHK